MGYIAYAIPFFLGLMGLELWLSRKRGVRVYKLEDSIANLGCGVLNQLFGLATAAGFAASYVWIYERMPFKLADGTALGWLAGFVGAEVTYYWWHRLSHEVNFLWAVHVVHHQSEEYNLSVALRQAFFSGLTSYPFFIPLALLGVPPTALFASAAIGQLYQFWIHTRLIHTLGPLELAFNTPSHHRVHHGRNPQYLDKNYGAILIVWDRLFRSFEPEVQAVDYGVKQPMPLKSPLYANFDWFVELRRLSAEAPDWKQALLAWVKFPGWRPQGVGLPPAPVVSPTEHYALAGAVGMLAAAIVLLFLLYFVTPGIPQLAGVAGVTGLVAALGRALDEPTSAPSPASEPAL
jgi:alkylglycerol monooxygenase